jgi:DNA-directed RNA polymerase III subunit RPC7
VEAGALTKSGHDGIERYSDKYEKRVRKEKLSAVPSPHHLFPDELVSCGNNNNSSAATATANKQFSFTSAIAKLQQAERDDHADPKDTADEESDGALPDEEVYEEEELEDETDYNLSYFDNGEDYDEGGGGEDGEPSY